MTIDAQGTKLEIASGAGGAEAISDIALGYPTILTSVAHALVKGDVVTLANFAGDDAADINGEVAVVDFVTDDTFAVAIDTTGKAITDNTDSATATPVAWTEVGEIIDFDGPNRDRSERDITNLQDTERKYKTGLPDKGMLSFSINWDHSDVGLDAVVAAYASGDLKNFKITFTDDETDTFAGYVKSYSKGGSLDGDVKGSITIRTQETA
jgi:hypothetical protein